MTERYLRISSAGLVPALVALVARATCAASATCARR